MKLVRKLILLIAVVILFFSIIIPVVKNVFLTKLETVNQEISLPEGSNSEIKRSGSFQKIDLIHKASGRALVITFNNQNWLKLDDFKVTPGPDLFVYLSKNSDINQSQDLGEFVSLGQLKSFQGDQAYVLPKNYDEYKSVVIWCRAFSALFSVAELG